MGLAAPWFLAGLALLGLPLWLHLLKRHLTIPLKFSSLMFFERSTESSVKQRRLDYLLLLALRLALLALVIFAFAKPFYSVPATPGDSEAMRLLVLDTSASMGAGTRMERAKRQADGVLAGLPAAAQAQVALLDTRLHFQGQPSQERQAARAAIASAKAGDLPGSLGEFSRAMRAWSATTKRAAEVHLFSDLQRTGMPPGFADLRLTPSMKLVLHPAVKQAEPNWAVETVTAPPRVREGKSARLRAVVAGFGTQETDRRVALEVNGKIAARKTVRVPASGRTEVEFPGQDIPYGFARCAILLEDPDALAADNRYIFAIERADPDKVLLVYGGSAAKSVTFYRDAVESAAGNAYAVDAIAAQQFRGSGAESARLTVLSDAVLEAGAEAAVRREVERGSGALVILGPANVSAGRAPLTGEPIRSSRYADRGGERFFTAAGGDWAHPALRDSRKWEGVRFYFAAGMESKTSRAIVSLSDGQPLLLEARLGAGRVLVLVSPLDGLAGDLPLDPAFVAFAGESARWLTGREEAAPLLAAGSSVDLKSASGARTVEALDPDGRRAVSMEESAKGVPLVLERAGFWTLRPGGGRTILIAANVDRRESDLAVMPEESAELWQSPASAPVDAGTVAGSGNLKIKRGIWPWILAAALLAAGAEIAVAARHMVRDTA
jgi:hypothetical protein